MVPLDDYRVVAAGDFLAIPLGYDGHEQSLSIACAFVRRAIEKP